LAQGARVARPGRGPPLWERADALPGEAAWPGAIDPQAQPAPDYEFDQRIAWQGRSEQGKHDEPTSLVGVRSRRELTRATNVPYLATLGTLGSLYGGIQAGGFKFRRHEIPD